jgi:hypothetical protein
MRLRRLVFPLPEGPATATNWPGATLIEIPSRATARPGPDP